MEVYGGRGWLLSKLWQGGGRAGLLVSLEKGSVALIMNSIIEYLAFVYNHVSILLGWEEGSVLACISRSSFVSESATMMGRWWSDHCSGFVYGPLNRQVFSTCLWHLK